MVPILNPDVMSRISALSPSELSQLYKPELSDDADDRFNLNLTVGERRLLEHKAKASNQSSTKWLISQIRGAKEAPKNPQANVAFSLDSRRLEAASARAQELGFVSVEDMAKDLVYQAINNPELAEEFLFGNLRKR